MIVSELVRDICFTKKVEFMRYIQGAAEKNLTIFKLK